MMKFTCTVRRLGNDQWHIRHTSADAGVVEVTARSRAAAREKMRNELRYRLELSPCCGEAYKDVPIDLVEER